MNNKDYSIFYKTSYRATSDLGSAIRHDVFISAFTSAERVQSVFQRSTARSKHWIVFREYGYAPDEYPTTGAFVAESAQESEIIPAFWDQLPEDTSRSAICVDITGFIRPHLLFFIAWLQQKGIRRFDAIYSEPVKYAKRDRTEFSDQAIDEIRQVAGYEGIHTPDLSNDLLIIGAGYENHLISWASKSKDQASKSLLFGFPPLRADMYQENVLRAHLAEEDTGSTAFENARRFFAPANDPFVTANVLGEMVGRFEAKKGRPITNLYLCPLSTKAQALGFAVYYLTECRGRPASVIFPFSPTYSKETSTGIARIWKYSVELPPLSP